MDKVDIRALIKDFEKMNKFQFYSLLLANKMNYKKGDELSPA